MNNRRAETWWQEHFSGLETDSCPAIDYPDNEQGGAFSETAVSFANTDQETVTAAFAYTLAKYTAQNESLFWIRANGSVFPFFASFDENVSAESYCNDITVRLRETKEHADLNDEELAGMLFLNRELLLCFDSDYEPDAASGWRLCLQIKEDRLILFFRRDWYIPENMHRLAEMVKRIIIQLPDCGKLKDLKLADDADIAAMESFPHWEKSVSAKSITELLARAVVKYPDSTAVVFEDETLTYARMESLTNSIAAKMASMGIGKGSVVSTLLPRCKWMPVVAIAILKTGAAYQPLDPSYPPERLNFMVRDSGAALAVSDRSLKELISEFEGPFLFTDELDALPAAEPLDREIGPDDTFILLYTSGTTGTPKGVILRHGNLVNFVEWYNDRFGQTHDSRSAAYASFGFDANMMDTYPILCAGGQLHILSDKVRYDLRAINRYFNENGITHSFMTTQVGRQFTLMTDCKTLKAISMGGETLVPFTPPHGIDVYNGYGPTECTIYSTTYKLTSGSKRLPIGVPVFNTRLYIADRFRRLLPIGAMGELLISGAQVGAGYLNCPEKTAETFIKNPFTDDPAYADMYCTGDIVRWGNDGNVEFVGRRDGQVKIRGFRIELTEVESVLREYPGVTDATVVARNAPAGGKMICAYIVADNPVDIPELEQFIRDRKPPYMVPSFTMQIEKIPLNVNSKVDKRALPEPSFTPAADEKSGIRVKTTIEEKLYGIIAPIVGVNDFPVNARLVDDLGLTSISALILAVEIEKSFGYSPDVDVLASGSLLSIENALVDHFMSSSPSEVSSCASDGPYPLTQTQLGIYSACMMEPETDAYDLPFLFRLSHDTDTERLCRALEDTVAAHQTLNCRILPDRQHTAVMVAEERNFHAEIEDITEEELSEKMKHLPRFDFENGPLYDAKVYRTGEAVYLYVNFHHIIFDGTSLTVFMEDLEKAFKGDTLVPEKYTSFNLALDERNARQSSAYEEAKAYYDSVFSGVNVSSLPDGDFPGGETKSGHTQKLLLDAGFAEKVQAWCADNKVTENAFFTFAFAFTLAKVNGTDEALFCNIYNGRNDPRTFRMTGMLVKTYPFYMAFSASDNPAGLVKETAKLIRELTAHDLYSFAEVSRAYGIKPDILFAYQGNAFNSFTVAGQQSESMSQNLGSVQAPLSVDVFQEGDTYSFNADYFTDRYTCNMIRMLLDLFARTAQQLLEVNTLDDIDLMTEEARDILTSANDTDWPVEFKPAHCLLEENAVRYPDRLAVVTPAEELTYSQLNKAANRAAHSLIDLGVIPGQITALMLPRNANVYIVRQAILKAGGAFLSIAPDYPDDRIKTMLEDSGAKVLIVDEYVLAERRTVIGELSCKTVTVPELLKNTKDSDPGILVGPDELAYTIFTSGSTGKPKGVMLTQKNLVNFVNANPKNREILGYTQYGHVSLALAAITFDVSIMEEFIPLANGMTICMATEEEIHNPVALSKLMLEKHVDIMTCTPSFLTNIIGLPVMKEALSQVMAYDLGAEAFPGTLFDRINAINPQAYIMNGYGPTEATISCTMDRVTTPKIITIGRPAGNVKAFVLDSKGRKLPPLVPGELIIAGDGVGKGYVGRPDLTEEKFFEIDGLPAYHTGDLAEWTADGRLAFHGRTDNQVKLRGLRVELGEIESAINAVPGVLTSIVIMTGDENNRFLAGYYTAGREIRPADLKTEISRSLTSYMVPGVLMQLPEMPLTPNGKIDKKKLPKAEYSPDAGDYVAPANDVEADFCAWFADVLGLEKVSAEGNFFELGGTSLSATVIAMNAEDKGYNIVYADVFRAQTPRALAVLAGGGKIASADDDQTDLRNFDYSSLNLAHNVEEELPGLTCGPVGNLLLTGATGFLGIHVLREYLERYDGTVYCLLRGNNPDVRLCSLYFYYFNKDLNPLLESGRVQILNGDITDAESLRAADPLPFDTLFNCAALVKHFVKDDSLERINVQGVRNLIDLCRRTGKRLIQTSTVSVAGEGLDGKPPRNWRITENLLYNGQLLDNAYALSKFKAEKAILEAVSRGLDAKIMRLGNLMGRHSDGEFQANFRSNAFIRALASYKVIGAVPFSLMNVRTDFSEIDMTARAILLLSGTNREFTVFHPMNNHTVTYADIVYSMREYGFKIDTVEDDVFADRKAAVGNASGALIAYQSREGEDRRYELEATCDFTTNALYRLGFKWPVSGEKYIISMLKALDGLTMFED